jgi:hypothetical protein
MVGVECWGCVGGVCSLGGGHLDSFRLRYYVLLGEGFMWNREGIIME